MKKLLPVSFLLAATLASGAWAEPPKECPMKSRAELNISASGTSDSAASAFKKIQDTFGKVEKMMKDAKLESYQSTRQDYNINARHNGQYSDTNFSYSANSNYSMEPADKAADMLEAVTKEGMRGSINVRNYRDRSC